MNQLQEFLEAVPLPFRSEVAKEQRTLAKIEKARQDREARLRIITQARLLRDKIPLMEVKEAELSGKMGSLTQTPVEKLYDMFIGGELSVTQLTQALTDQEIIAKHAPEINKRAHKKFMETAIFASKQFEKENAAALKGVDLTKPDDAKFAPPSPVDEWTPAPPLTAKSLMTGNFNSETPPPAWHETNGSNRGITINKTDDDD
jgi:hypothetical protein